MFTIVCCSVVELGLGLDLVSGLVAMHYFHYFRFSLQLCRAFSVTIEKNLRDYAYLSAQRFWRAAAVPMH